MENAVKKGHGTHIWKHAVLRSYFFSFIVAVLRSLKVCHSSSFFIFLWHRKACTYNTLYGTHNIINFKDAIIHLSQCFDFSSSSHPHRSFLIPFPFMWFSLCWQHEKPARSFDAFPVYDLQICEKHYGRKQERGGQPLILFFVFQMEFDGKNETARRI